MTYSALPAVDSTNFGPFGGPEISIASLSYKIVNYIQDRAQVNSKTALQYYQRLPAKVVKLVAIFRITYRIFIK